MISQGGRVVARLPQSSAQCLASGPPRFNLAHFQRVAALYNSLRSHNQSKSTLCIGLPVSVWRRTYATKPVSRPKAHTGRTTATARKAPTTSKTKAAKKPAPKKTTAKARPKAKSVAKPRIKAKPKTAKKAKLKRKPKKVSKKVLTEAQKKAATIKSLKEAALRSPTQLASTAWHVFNNEILKARPLQGADLGARVKEASAEFKDLSPEKLEHYNHIANQNKANNTIAYRQWIESHTPSEIYTANLARQNLKRRGVKHHVSPLHDDRQVKRPRSAYIRFTKERFSSGDLKGLKMPEAGRLVGREWKGLSAGEKKPYEDAQKQDQARYHQEMKTVVNKE